MCIAGCWRTVQPVIMRSEPVPYRSVFGSSVLAACLVLISLNTAAQTATDACGTGAGSKYTVNTSCVYSAFNKPAAFTPNYAATGCNGSNNDDAWGGFTATSTTTT